MEPKEMNEEAVTKAVPKASKKKSKKMSKLRKTIMMSILCIAMMSGTTYAWFTLSNSAKTTGLSLTVAGQGNLYIAGNDTDVKTGSSSYKLNMDGVKPVLYPATTKDGKEFFQPNYTSTTEVGSVVKTTAAATSTNNTGYYYTEDFWMYVDEGTGASASNSYNINLEKYATGTNADGTHLTVDGSNGAQSALRVSFVVTDVSGDAVAIYEPYSDITTTPAANEAAGSAAAVTSEYGNTAYGSKVVKQTSGGAFIRGSLPAPLNEGDSDILFTIKNNTAVKVTMYVWIEGTDTQCGNAIMNGTLAGQFRFTANKVNTTTP